MSPQQHSRQPAPPYSGFSPSDMPVLPPYTAKGDRLSAEPIVMGQASSANSAASQASEPTSASPSPPAAGAAAAAASASTSDAEATGSMPQFLAQPQPAHISGKRP
ncbi:hypothetical protein HMPREF1624_05494 [Sporothrix schenckii ATCC 58251]|uniref:Uncharacterized protein n=1 Tax=Sporothrix schenckii (strain ATCC 58251 / de Perez 2211183) TaxID=1391915 RepID=U7PSX6_SPOS1|nr:hypothetical protein HMPREF1624_05494 [Sporothrix schenckii ATCC 58251]